MFRFAVLLSWVTTLAYCQDTTPTEPLITQPVTVVDPLPTSTALPTEDLLPITTGVATESGPVTTQIPELTTPIPDFITTEPPEEITEKTTAPQPITEREPASAEVPEVLRVMPKIKEHPKNVTVPEDSYAKFFCSATGTPSPHLVIVRADSNYVVPEFSGENQIVVGEVSLPEVQQTIGPITKDNEGWYECIAANFEGTVKSRAYLRVLDLCSGVQCKAPKECVQDVDEATAGCLCPQLLCEMEYKPVCGSDCTVHFNPCIWNQTSCSNDYDSSTIIGTGTECPITTDPEVTLLEGEDTVIDEGQRFRLKAGVKGYPEPNVEWQKIDNDGNFLLSVGKGLELIIHHVTVEMSGRYIARATNCQTRHVHTRSVVLDVKPLPEPTEPSTEKEDVHVCSVFGDPHIVTFDKHSLHFAGSCTYLLAMDCAGYSWFAYGLFTYCGVGTCLAKVTLFINYKPIILDRGWVMIIEGEKISFIEGKKFEAGGMSWSFDGLVLKGRNDDLGLSVSWDGFVTFNMALDDSKGDTMCGVCGNNDREKGNEHEQSTKLEDRLVESLQSNVYVNNWKIDREKICVLPDEVDFDPNEPCGTNYGKSREAVGACQAIVENAALQRCTDTVDLKFYYDSCLYDYCYMGLLRESDDPFAKPSPVIQPECTVALAYATVCEMEGIPMRGWDVYMKCDREATQDAIVSIASFQETLPFIRFRK